MRPAAAKLAPRSKAQYWELFTTFYRNLIEMPADHLPHTFVEAFAAAYREALKNRYPEAAARRSWRRGWDSNPRAGITRPSDFESAPL